MDQNYKQVYLDDYLYTRLFEIIEESENELIACYRVALVISFAHDELDEVRLSFYTEHLNLNKDNLADALHYFAGAGFCKIEGVNEELPSFQKGANDREVAAKMYLDTAERIATFRADFWSK